MPIITNYATLQTAIADYLEREDLTAFIPQFIQSCENKLYRRLNLRNEETALSVAISSGVATVPTDFKALKFAYYDGAPVQVLNWVPLHEIYDQYPVRTQSTIPRIISREAGNFVFGPAAADGTLKGVYYAKKAPLRTTDPSWYVTNAPEVLLYGSLLEAEPFLRNDERLMVWKEFYMDGIGSLLEEDGNAQTSKGPLIARPDVVI